eukprot:gene17300-19032_t
MALSRFFASRFLLPNLCHVQSSRGYTFIKKRLVSMEEYLKMSRTSGADYSSILKRLNLREEWPNFQGTTAEVQLLRNLNVQLEYKYIRHGKSFPTYYRIDLMKQRLEYMSTMGMTPREKIKLLKRKPPVLILCEHQVFDSSGMVYLRGIARDGLDFNYVFYPAFPRVACKKPFLESRLESICEELKADKERILKMVMSIPCFSIRANSWDKYQDKTICLHRRTLPEAYDVDSHTFEILPPIYSGLGHFHLLDQLQPDIKIPDLAGNQLSDLLDLSYTSYNGKGKPEDYTEFMNRAYKEEKKYNPPKKYK